MQIAYTGKRLKKGSYHILLCDGDRYCRFYCIFSCPPQKNTSKQEYIFEEEEASVQVCMCAYVYTYIHTHTCLNEQQQWFGYTECESNPWVTPMQLMRMVFNYFEITFKKKKKEKGIMFLSLGNNEWRRWQHITKTFLILTEKYTINHRSRHIRGIQTDRLFGF